MIRPTATDVEGLIFDVDTFAVHDGPGIRMAVYLKGCPLACRWCHSPESQHARPEVILIGDRCALCGQCGTVCRQGVHEVRSDAHTMAGGTCVVCGRCVEACPARALAVKGCTTTAGVLVAKAARLKPFFAHAGGGVTLTGGEVTAQVDFAEAILAGCRAEGVHTAIETCGACDWASLERLADATDLVLYDLKLIDDAQHKHWTGASNRAILDNARRLAGRNVEARIPLIPGITDTEANLRAIFAFMADAGLARATLLPFNPSAGAKYEWFGRTCEVDGQVQDDAYLRDVLALAAASGLAAKVG